MRRPLPVRLALAAFDRWEAWSTEPLESVLGSPRLTGPAGEWLSLMARGSALQQRWVRAWCSAWGVPSQESQERALHTLNEIQSRLYDVEDQLNELREGR